MLARAYGALVLAAGRGVRVGGPKALLIVDGAPLPLLHARAHAGAQRVVVVVNEEVEPVLAPMVPEEERGRVRLVVNRLPNGWGPAASLRVALGEIEACERWIVGPVDALPPRAETIATLLDALEADVEGGTPDAARFARGHPIAARAALLCAAYAGEGAPPPLRDVLARARVTVLARAEDPAVTTELDSIEDVARVTGGAPRFVG